jgi:hypothetical protein
MALAAAPTAWEPRAVRLTWRAGLGQGATQLPSMDLRKAAVSSANCQAPSLMVTQASDGQQPRNSVDLAQHVEKQVQPTHAPLCSAAVTSWQQRSNHQLCSACRASRGAACCHRAPMQQCSDQGSEHAHTARMPKDYLTCAVIKNGKVDHCFSPCAMKHRSRSLSKGFDAMQP